MLLLAHIVYVAWGGSRATDYWCKIEVVLVGTFYRLLLGQGNVTTMHMLLGEGASTTPSSLTSGVIEVGSVVNFNRLLLGPGGITIMYILLEGTGASNSPSIGY